MPYEQEFMLIFSRNLREQMERHSLTQNELAEKLGVSQSSVSDWCMGRKQPRMSKVDKMCEIFGCSRESLMLSDDERQKYYTNEESAEVAQALHDNPNLKILFDAAKDVSPEDLLRVAAMIKAFKDSATGGGDNG